jgi:hypothetical protein
VYDGPVVVCSGGGWIDNFLEIPENYEASWIRSYVDTLGSSSIAVRYEIRIEDEL